MFNIAIRISHPRTGEYIFNNNITYGADQLNIIYINASEVQQHRLLSTPTVQEDRPFETIQAKQGVIWEIGKVLSVSLFLCVSSVRDHTHPHVHTHTRTRAHTHAHTHTRTCTHGDGVEMRTMRSAFRTHKHKCTHKCTQAKYTRMQTFSQ